MLDSADALADVAGAEIEPAATASTSVKTRLAAIERIARRVQAAALALADTDRDQRVRTWAHDLRLADSPTRDFRPGNVAKGRCSDSARSSNSMDQVNGHSIVISSP